MVSHAYSWFYKDTCRNESEDIVEKDGREGCFMVRDSSRPGVYTLTILVKAGGLVIKHNSFICVITVPHSACNRVFSLLTLFDEKKHRYCLYSASLPVSVCNTKKRLITRTRSCVCLHSFVITL